MKGNSVQDLLSHLRLFLPGENLMRKYANEKPPLRSELFSADQMDPYGKLLAASHRIIPGPAPNKLLKRLADNEEMLLEVHELMTDAVKTNRRIIPAGEWLLDNFYLIQEHIRTGKKHLPKGYSEDLPLLSNGPSAGLPRVYDIAIEIISHSDGRVDSTSLNNFIQAYQTVTPLKLGELWAIPIMLRLALIENLRRLAAQIAVDRINQNLADYWADQMIETAEKDPKSLILVVADMARSGPPLVSSFVAELSRRLQGKGPALVLPLNWIEQRLSETGQTTNELVQAEFQKQAADQVSMSNSINSLRFLGTTDWRVFVETNSIVEQTLRGDIGGVYARMDFTTRDQYRHVVEKISKNSYTSETEVARMAIRFAKESAEKKGPEDRMAHVGYYLVGAGLRQTEQAAKMEFSAAEKGQKIVHRFPLLIYTGAIILFTLVVGGSLFAKTYSDGEEEWLLILVAILLVISVSQLAVTLVNWMITLVVKPRLLPRMDFSKGISAECRTLVAVPTMIGNERELENMMEALEVRFLANRDKMLHFALLTDFPDADLEILPGELALLQLAQQKVEDLNAKYDADNNDIFFLFHRPRQWNPREKIWMGYERKRGKLTELNSLLRGGKKESFSLIVGEQEIFPEIKYVITLDSDTQLPREAAWKIVGTMAHPLNRPFLNEKKERVTEGHGILQPRVAVSLTGSNRSFYARLHGNDVGIDPYTRATSDVYQDLFDEGSFIGKGIYDVDIFSKTLNNRFPENRILSHDLLEGCYLRSGLLSDVLLYEEYPSSYLADVKRRHRWIRGDWQIATWMLPFVPGSNKRLKKNPLSALSRWKIFDNIRRSLVPLAQAILLLLGWTILHSVWFWTLAVVAMIMLPFLIISARDILKKPKDILLRQHFKDSVQYLTNDFIKTVFTIVCLPYEAFYTFNAILLTNWRMIVTGRKLLEWSPSHSPKINQTPNLLDTFLSMWIGPVIGTGAMFYLLLTSPLDLVITWPVITLWIVSPAVAWFVSRPKEREDTKLTGEQNIFLQKLARKTWAFFETFVGPLDNWLPPDNYQEHPVERVAHRTSPTNMGISLLANLAARDFGYMTTGEFMERTGNSLKTMEGLERYRGHFYNWYDTISMLPLPPRYVSTVDSGNLCGHLFALREGIRTIAYEPIANKRWFEGLRDTFYLLQDEVKGTTLLDKFKLELEIACENPPLTLSFTRSTLEKLFKIAVEIFNALKPDPESDQFMWASALLKQSKAAWEEFSFLTLWSTLLPAPASLADFPDFENIPSLQELAVMDERVLSVISQFQAANNTAEEKNWFEKFETSITNVSRFASQRIESLDQLASQCNEFLDCEYDFLYDPTQHLVSIGYNVVEHRRDPSFYDLLASEARLCSFVGIAQGKLPQENWFALGRQLTKTSGEPILLSWSGSMFEYLMPLLIMPTYENTLLDQTNKATVVAQIDYCEQRGVCWGVSESGYNMVDANLNYQYRAFGVPGLGLKRGLAEDLVIAPYASVLALMVAPEEACKNLEELASEGFEGRYGFFEAIDYTPARLPRGKSYVVVRSFMVHHQGMSLLSLAYLLLDQPMQKRFVADPQIQSALLLLQERIPKTTVYHSLTSSIEELSVISNVAEMRVIKTPDTSYPEVHLLSNGRYHVMVTNAGGGYSRWRDLAVSRWREDTTCDNWGTFCYIRDLETGTFWSTGHQPTLKQSKNYEVIFSQGRAEFRRRDYEIETHTEIVVSPEDDIEIRRVHITNRSRKRRSMEITSYSEVVLTSPVADSIHPAFSNLFVQTEILSHQNAILCTRRPRSVEEKAPWMFHLMKAHSSDIKGVSYETDRMEFIGRGNAVVNPKAMEKVRELSGSQGSVLDPIVAIQYQINLNPQETIVIDMVYGIGETREVSQGLIDKYQDRNLTDRAFELAYTHSQVVLRQINASEGDEQLFGQLASAVIYANPTLRADPAILTKNHRGQSGLWSYSISGDLPIVLIEIEDQANIDLVKQMVQAHAYWRLKGLVVDLVIWNEDYGGYRQQLQNQLLALISAGVETDSTERPGGIFVRAADQVSPEDRILFQTVARINISDRNGTLIYQVNKKSVAKPVVPYLTPKQLPLSPVIPVLPRNDLQYYNGLGGFSADGKEYIISTTKQVVTPAPWVNVLANPQFGTVISESGEAYTWVENAHEFRLSPWNNDPVTDSAGEVFYIRDDETGAFWSPMPLPSRGKTPYVTRHGFGYSVFEHREEGISSEALVYVDINEAIKFTVIKIKNHSDRLRKISTTGYVEWILGDLKPKSSMHIVTDLDSNTGALLARNPYNTEFPNQVGFFAVNDPTRTFTSDRTEFIGRNGTLRSPEAMIRMGLTGKVGAGLDPCGALQVVCELAEEQEIEFVFLLGSAKNNTEASNLVRQYRGSFAAQEVIEKVGAYWLQTLGALQVETPDTSLNLLANGWLHYQTLACRIWARSGYYQSGGAFGFRDQLQDVLAIVHTDPELVRKHILLCASRQFREGDVQHWWHPPTGRGVRTRCSDDYLWLPLATCRYVQMTGDRSILEESIYYLEGRPLNPNEESYYDLPGRSDLSGSLYDHCVKAIQHGLQFGEHGLPLIGSGDWNDGMDKVGQHGKGESVWLGFFLYDVLMQFTALAARQGDKTIADLCKQQAVQLRNNIDRNAWDGQWYRRAYFDDGTPLGSASNEECQIDSISQSWSVLSGAGQPARSLMAMESAYNRLVQKNMALIQLLDPPFNKSNLNPGYIKGYVPGVRENGGQYTHAAIWLVMAFAALRNTNRTWELFNMINPINHGNTADKIASYKVEPYVVAADVYTIPLHRGRGGWTWYTGSAGWMYRLIIESLLGLKREKDKLRLDPCIPIEWDSFTVHYRYENTVYDIKVVQITTGKQEMSFVLDGVEQNNMFITLVDDHHRHAVEVRIKTTTSQPRLPQPQPVE